MRKIVNKLKQKIKSYIKPKVIKEESTPFTSHELDAAIKCLKKGKLIEKIVFIMNF